MLTDACKNNMLNSIGITYLSLHNGFSATGTGELTGGSPAYARKSVTLGGASGGSISPSNVPIEFDVPAGATVRFIGYWTALTGGTFLGMMPNGGSPKEYLTDTTADKILADSNGFANNDKIVFSIGATGGAVPGGLTQGTIYYVTNSTTDDFQVALAVGGSPINLTSKNSTDSYVSKIIEETYGANGKHTVQNASWTLNF